MLAGLSPQIRQYLLVTGNYWAFTLTDGALRMLVVLACCCSEYCLPSILLCTAI